MRLHNIDYIHPEAPEDFKLLYLYAKQLGNINVLTQILAFCSVIYTIV